MSSTAGAISTPILRHAAQVAAQTLLSVLVALALVMLVRRAGGSLLQPLPSAALVVVAIVLAVTAATIRMVLFDLVGCAMYSMPGLAAAAMLAAVTLSGTPALAIALAWFILIGSEGLSWLIAYRPELLRGVRTRRTAKSQGVSAESTEETGAEVPVGLVQQLTRLRNDGRESIHAVLLAEIPPGDRQAALHVAFCPPLDEKPELTAHALEADNADARITQAETFGARIELRVQEIGMERRSVLVEVLGSAICR